MSRFLKFLVPCALAGLFANPLNALASMAATIDGPLPSRVVEFGDLDLGRDTGVATLYTRIRTAAREVCEPIDVVFIKLLRERFDCRKDAVARAVADVNSPALTDYYLAKTKTIAGNPR